MLHLHIKLHLYVHNTHLSHWLEVFLVLRVFFLSLGLTQQTTHKLNGPFYFKHSYPIFILFRVMLPHDIGVFIDMFVELTACLFVI